MAKGRTSVSKVIRANVRAVYDAGPEQNDRYTVVLKPVWEANPGHSQCLGFNAQPTHPSYGISQFSECVVGRHLGKKIKFADLPEHLREHVVGRLAQD